MNDSTSATSVPLATQEPTTSLSKEVAEAVGARIKMLGLNQLDLVVKELDTAQKLLGSVSWWTEARKLCDGVIADARQEALKAQEAREARDREYELEMARIRSQQNVFWVQQQLPNATAGLNAEGNMTVDQANVVTGAQASVTHTKNS
jgi:hypothetical protein